jgi:hypothetical protein
VYQNASGLRKHKISKTSCIPKNELEKINNEKKNKEIQLYEIEQKLLQKEKETKLLLEEKEKETSKLLQEKEIEISKLLQEKETEIIRLRNLMENNLTKDVQEIKNKIIESNLSNLEIKNKIIENNLTNEEIKDKLTVVDSKIESTNNANINYNYNMTQNNKNDNKKLKFNIQLAPGNKERLDHIPVEQILSILDQEDFGHSIADLVQAISFNPKAPENMTWCVSDKTSELGAIQYNEETNMLIRDTPTNVITKNLQNILFPVTDILRDLEVNTSLKLNPQQNKNSDKYFDMLGQDSYKKEYIKCIKDRAYDKRGLCKALWDHLEIGLEVVKSKRKIKLI